MSLEIDQQPRVTSAFINLAVLIWNHINVALSFFYRIYQSICCNLYIPDSCGSRVIDELEL